MSEHYISKPDKWRMMRIPFTPYYLCRHPDTKLWVLAEKEFNFIHKWNKNSDYSFRLL